MKRIDLLKLRKMVGLSQKELADRLSVQPSFLSAIENGRSRFPDEKLERLKEILGIDNFDDFLIEENAETTVVPPHTHIMDESDSLSQLLRHIHNLAHKSDAVDRGKEKELMSRIDYLSQRNDRLSDRLDELRLKVDTLREENFRLKEIILKNNLSF